MQDSATVQLSLPMTWLTKIQHLAEQRDRASEEILQAAIAQYLGVPLPHQDSRLDELEADINDLKRQIRHLTTAINQAQLPERVTAIPVSPAAPPRVASIDAERSQPSENWIDDDEPDEILYDFLPPEER